MLNENILIGDIIGHDSRTEQVRPRVDSRTDSRTEYIRLRNDRPGNGAAEFAEKVRKAMESDADRRAASRSEMFAPEKGVKLRKSDNRRSAAKTSSDNDNSVKAKAAAGKDRRADTRKTADNNSPKYESGEVHAGNAAQRNHAVQDGSGRMPVAGEDKIQAPVEAGDNGSASIAGASGVHSRVGAEGTVLVDNYHSVYDKHSVLHNQAVAATTSENRAAQHFSVTKDISEHSVFTLTNSVALEVRNNQASELIEQALSNLTSMLKLPSEFTPDTQSLIKFDRDGLEQLAEILVALERIGSLLDKAAVGAETLKLPDMEIGVDDAAALSADVRTEKFHIQMGLNIIGAREIVAGIMAEKSGEYSVSGISQATAPADLGMSAIDTARVFGGMIEEDLTAAIGRMCSAKDELAANSQAADAKQQVASELTAADSRAMREMFKAIARENHNHHNNNRADEAQTARILSVNSENAKAGVTSNDMELPVSISELTNDKTNKNRPGTSSAFISILSEEAAKAKVNTETVNTGANVFVDKITASAGNETAQSAAKAEHAKPGANHHSVDKNTASINSAIAQFAENNAGGSGTQSDAGQSETNQADVAQAKAGAATESIQKTANAFSRVDQEAVIRQIIEKMQNVVRTGAGMHEVRMILRPEALGEVRMSLRVEGDVVFARMQVENSQVKAIVESQMQSLKDSLSEQNLHTASLSVDVRSDSGDSRSDRQEMAELARIHKFRQDNGGNAGDVNGDGFVSVEAGTDTGRRFGNHTFEYFI